MDIHARSPRIGGSLMRIFVIGGTGILGKRMVPSLVREGHEVVTLTRSDLKSKLVKKWGGIPARGSLFDRDFLLRHVSWADVVINMATSIPQKTRTKPRDWKEHDRLRIEGTKLLTEVMSQVGCDLYIHQSVTFVHGHREGAMVDERTPVKIPIPTAISLSRQFQEILDASVLAEQLVMKLRSDFGVPSIILRFGWFYSEDSHSTRQMCQYLKKRRYPIIGDGTAFHNLIHVDDAARAVVRAVFSDGRTSGIFNVCDDEPVQVGTLLRYLARELRVRPPRRMRPFLAKLLIGEYGVNFMLSSVRVSNSLAKSKLGWKPQHSTYREGFQEVLAEMT